MRTRRRRGRHRRAARIPYYRPWGYPAPPSAPASRDQPAEPRGVGPVAVVDRVACTGCGMCARVCPADAISMDADGKAVVNPNVCRGCGVCVEHCPANAIRLAPG